MFKFKVWTWNHSWELFSFLCIAFRIALSLLHADNKSTREFADVRCTLLRRAAFLRIHISLMCLARERCTFTRRSMSSKTSLQSFSTPTGSYIQKAENERKSYINSFWRSFFVCMQIKIFTVQIFSNNGIACYRIKYSTRGT